MTMPFNQVQINQERNQWEKITSKTQNLAKHIKNLKGKRLLILGGSYLQLPAILEAKSMGLITAVLDYDAGCLGKDLADQFYLASTYDQEAVLESAIDFKADGIITLCTDWPMRSVAYSSEKLGLESISYATACRSTHKLDMIKQLEKEGVAHPHYISFNFNTQAIEDIQQRISLPCIIKPVDGSGSRGVILLKNVEDLEFALNYSASHSTNGELLIEEFMEGPEVSVEVLIQLSKPRVLAITDKKTTGYPHFVETQHTQPSRLTDHQKSLIKSLAIDACTALELTHGAAHVEIIFTKSGPKIVEVGPRMGGDFIATHLVSLSTGVNFTQLVILNALGFNPMMPPINNQAACIKYIDRGEGMFLGVNNLTQVSEIPGVIQCGVFLGSGTRVQDLHSSNDRLGYIIANAKTAEVAERIAHLANQTLQIRMEK